MPTFFVGASNRNPVIVINAGSSLYLGEHSLVGMKTADKHFTIWVALAVFSPYVKKRG